MQNPPKPKPMNWWVRKADSTSDPLFTVLGYEFTKDEREDSLGIAEGNSQEYNFRCAFLPEEGHYWLSRDFAGQELRIMANLSMEPAWINAFLNGEDIHKATAITIWGEDEYTPLKRKMAKNINFGLLYGSGAYGIAKKLDMEEKKAQELIDSFFEKLPKIKEFLTKCTLEAKETEQIKNLYGRVRRMSRFIDVYGRLMPAGKRRSYNFPIQSMGAEVTKLALINIYNKLLKNEKYKDNVFFMNTIHDEVNLSVKKDLIEEVTHLAGECMEHKIPGRPVPITTDIEIGNNMGLMWKFEQDKETLTLTPIYERKPDNE